MTQPYGSGNNWFHQAQETLIPNKHQGLPKSYALEWIEYISNNTKQEGTYHFVMARVQSAVLPVFVAASVIQLGGVVIADVAVSVLGYSHFHYQVGPSGQCSIKHVSIKEEFKELLKLIAALFTTVVIWPGAITFAPGVYHRKPTDPLPQTEEQAALDAAKGLGFGATSAESLPLALAVRERGAFLRALPPITEKNIDSLQGELIDGIEIGRLSYEKLEYISAIRPAEERTGNRPEYSQGCYSTTENFFNPETALFEEVRIDNPEIYLTPSLDKVFEAQVDCQKVSKEELALFLMKEHRFHKLVLIGATVSDLRDMEGLAHIHTLALRPGAESATILMEDLERFTKEYPNIKVYDLKGCTVDKEVAEFNEAFIVVRPTYTESLRRVHSANHIFEDQNDRFNRALFEIVKSYDSADKTFQEKIERLLELPAAKFITKFGGFKGTQLRTHHAKILLECLSKSCPYIEILDFRNCYMLDSEFFVALPECKAKHIYLTGCQYIYYRRAIERGEARDPEIHLTETLDHPGLERAERKYVLNMHLVTYGINRLFDTGTERLRLDKVALGHDKEEEIRAAIKSGTFPIIAKWAREPYSWDVKIYYLNENFSGVPLRE